MSVPAANPNPAATSLPAANVSLPLGLEVLRTYSGVLICLELVSVAHIEAFYLLINMINSRSCSHVFAAFYFFS